MGSQNGFDHHGHISRGSSKEFQFLELPRDRPERGADTQLSWLLAIPLPALFFGAICLGITRRGDRSQPKMGEGGVLERGEERCHGAGGKTWQRLFTSHVAFLASPQTSCALVTQFSGTRPSGSVCSWSSGWVSISPTTTHTFSRGSEDSPATVGILLVSCWFTFIEPSPYTWSQTTPHGCVFLKVRTSDLWRLFWWFSWEIVEGTFFSVVQQSNQEKQPEAILLRVPRFLISQLV